MIQKITLNKDSMVFDDEVAIDFYTTGMGVYCGSITVPKEQAKRYIFALNTIDRLLIKGKQAPLYRIAKLREDKKWICPCCKNISNSKERFIQHLLVDSPNC